MMLRMAGVWIGTSFKLPTTSSCESVAILSCFSGTRQELAPKGFHAVVVDAAGARDQLLRLSRCGHEGMHVNVRPLPGLPTVGARLVEIDVRQQEVRNVSGSQPFFCQTSLECR